MICCHQRKAEANPRTQFNNKRCFIITQLAALPTRIFHFQFFRFFSFLNDKRLASTRAAAEAVARAEALLDGKKSGERVEHVWGADESGQSIRKLKEALNVLAREYLDGGGIDEAERSLSELAVPHFHFQLVKEVVYLAMEVCRRNRWRADFPHSSTV